LPVVVFRELMFEALANRTGLGRATLEELVQNPELLPSQQAPETPAQQPAARTVQRPTPQQTTASERPPQAPEWDHSDNPPPLLDIPAEAYADDEPWPEATAETHDYPGAAKSPTSAPTSR